MWTVEEEVVINGVTQITTSNIAPNQQGGLENIGAGIYNVVVTDENGCTATETIGLTEPYIISLESTVINASCSGESDGSIDLNVTGGVEGYTYTWYDSNTIIGNVQDLSNLSEGDYSVVVADGNGCTISENFFVSENTDCEPEGCIYNDNGIDIEFCVGCEYQITPCLSSVCTDSSQQLDFGDSDCGCTDDSGSFYFYWSANFCKCL